MLKKIDIHVHTRYPLGPMRSPKENDNYCTPEQLIERFAEYSIERAVILPGVNPECSIHTQSLNEVMAICERYPDNFSWFMNIDPRAVRNDPNSDFTGMLNFYKERGAKGLGEICANLYFDDPRVLKLFADCEKCNVPVLFHMTLREGNTYGLIDDLGLPRLEKVLSMFPKLTFLAHSQAFWAHMSADIDVSGTGGVSRWKGDRGKSCTTVAKIPQPSWRSQCRFWRQCHHAG